MRVGECEPNLLHLARCEETIDYLDIRSQESNVGQTFAQRFGSTAPHTGSLDIHANEVAVGITASQAHSIFAVLRQLDEIGAKRVFVRAPQETGESMAVSNRLMRAAGFDEVVL